jgi:hypothetical protein
MTRIARLLALLTTAVLTLGFTASNAYASLPGPVRGSGGFAAPTTPSPTIVTHTTTTGLTVWAVVLIAVASVAIGAALTEAYRSMRRRSGGRRLATA